MSSGRFGWRERPCSSVTIVAPRLAKERAPRFGSRIPTRVAERKSPICATTARAARRAARRPAAGAGRSRPARQTPQSLRVGVGETPAPHERGVRARGRASIVPLPARAVYGWSGAADPARRAGERRQGRGSARSLRRRARPGPVPRRPQPGRGRAGRARPARRCRRCSGARSGRSTISSAAWYAAANVSARPSLAAPAGARPRPRDRRGRRARRMAASATFRRLRRGRSPTRSASSRRPSSSPATSRTTSAPSSRPTATECERLGRRPPTPCGGGPQSSWPSDLGAWDSTPVLVYGFEDLSGVQWRLLEALAAAPTSASRCRTSRPSRVRGARAHGERSRCARRPPDRGAPGAGVVRLAVAGAPRTRAVHGCGRPSRSRSTVAVRFLEAAGTRAALELVGAEILGLLRERVPAEEIAVVCPSVESRLASIETAFGALGVPHVFENVLRLGRTPFGRALLGLCRFAWLEGDRADLYRFLRSPYSGIPRQRVDMVEGRLRGRAVWAPDRVEEETLRLLGHRIPALDRLREEPAVRSRAIRAVAPGCCAAAWGLERPPLEDAAGLRSPGRGERPAGARRAGAGRPRRRRRARGAGPGRSSRSRSPPRAPVAGRVRVLDLLRARTRRFRVVFVLGLEEGVLPRRASDSPFLTDEQRRRARGSSARQRGCFAPTRSAAIAICSTRPARGPGSVCTSSAKRRPTRAARSSRARSGKRCVARFASADVERFTRRRPLSALSWELHLAPTERERLRAVAALAGRSESPGPRAGGGRRLGAPDRARPRCVSACRRGSRTRPCFEGCGSRPASRPPSSRSSSTARRCGSSSGCSTRRRSTRRSTRDFAASSPIRRCGRSMPACPSGSASRLDRPGPA